MIERVARALAVKADRQLQARGILMVAGTNWKDKLAEARSAIAAMREPTEAMAAAGVDSGAMWCCDFVDTCNEVWTEMIDAALADDPLAPRVDPA